jgi:hypothetical protein
MGEDGGIAKQRREGRDSKTQEMREGGITKHGRGRRDSKTQEIREG